MKTHFKKRKNHKPTINWPKQAIDFCVIAQSYRLPEEIDHREIMQSKETSFWYLYINRACYSH
jgi:hypothetical protein